MKRPDLDTYFMEITSKVAMRATCVRHQVGATAVRDKHILCTGYNGAPSGIPDCLELGCLRDAEGIKSGTRQEICRAVHAEQNVIIQASLHGVSLRGATIYCTFSPCILCAKMFVNAHIVRFVYLNRYADEAFEALFRQADITFVRPSPRG